MIPGAEPPLRDVLAATSQSLEGEKAGRPLCLQPLVHMNRMVAGAAASYQALQCTFIVQRGTAGGE